MITIAEDKPYKILTLESSLPDYPLAVKFEPLLRSLQFSFHFDRHQLVFTDDASYALRAISTHFLNVLGLTGQKLSALEAAMIGMSLSADEVANSPVYTDLHGDIKQPDAHAPDYDPLDYANPKRLARNNFQRMIITDLSSPAYPAFAREMWRQYGFDYDNVDPGYANFKVFTDHDVAPLTMAYFEAHTGGTPLFVNLIGTQEADDPHKFPSTGFIRCLQGQKWYGEDHGDYLNRIPPTLWIVPFEFYPFLKEMYYTGGIDHSDQPNMHFMLSKPLDHWLDELPKGCAEMDELRKGYSISCTFYTAQEIAQDIDRIAAGANRLITERHLGDITASARLGLGPQELLYIKDFKNPFPLG